MTFLGAAVDGNKVVIAADARETVIDQSSAAQSDRQVLKVNPIAGTNLVWGYRGQNRLGHIFSRWLEFGASAGKLCTWEAMRVLVKNQVDKLNRSVGGEGAEGLGILIAGILDGRASIYYVDEFGRDEMGNESCFAGSGFIAAQVAWEILQHDQTPRTDRFLAVFNGVVERVWNLRGPTAAWLVTPECAPKQLSGFNLGSDFSVK